MYTNKEGEVFTPNMIILKLWVLLIHTSNGERCPFRLVDVGCCLGLMATTEEVSTLYVTSLYDTFQGVR